MGKWARPAVVSAVGAVVAYFLLRSTSWTDIGVAVARVSVARLAVGFAVYMLFVGLKAARFSSLLGGVTSRRLMYGILCAQTFWSNLLPMRAGEISYVHLLRSRKQGSGAGGVASLVVAGILDLWWMLALATALGWALLGVTTDSATLKTLTALAAAAFLAVPLAVVGSRRMPRVASLVVRLPAVGALLARMTDELQRQTWSKPLAAGAVFSGLALVCRYGFQLYLLDAMFDSITWMQGLFALVFAGLANLLPIQGVGNVGSIELPWAWALILVGVEGADAVASGFALHGIVLVYALGAGIVSLALLRATRPAEPSP
jgi:glycosyltransferase 2 family protein